MKSLDPNLLLHSRQFYDSVQFVVTVNSFVELAFLILDDLFLTFFPHSFTLQKLTGRRKRFEALFGWNEGFTLQILVRRSILIYYEFRFCLFGWNSWPWLSLQLRWALFSQKYFKQNIISVPIPNIPITQINIPLPFPSKWGLWTESEGNLSSKSQILSFLSEEWAVTIIITSPHANRKWLENWSEWF